MHYSHISSREKFRQKLQQGCNSVNSYNFKALPITVAHLDKFLNNFQFLFLGTMFTFFLYNDNLPTANMYLKKNFVVI